MRLIVSDIPEDGLQQEADLQIAIRDNAQKENAHVFIKAYKYGSKVLIEGSVEMSALLVCSRCLREFSFPLNVSFNEEYLAEPEVIGEGEHELRPEDSALSFYSNDEINIEDLIREQIILTLPIKSLCKSECLGICSRCGKEMNNGLCGCKKDDIDPRLMPLKKIKESLENRKE